VFVNIAGMGIVFSRGRGIASLEQALQEGWVPPSEVEVRGLDSRLPVYPVSAETLTDKAVLAKARRADRFVRMSVLAASDAIQDSGLAGSLDKQRLGVIIATALGPHVTTFNFLDGIIDFGDAAVSPTAFSHSVHNAAASYVAMTLDVRGPTLTMTHFHFAFHDALLLARAWLDEKRCDSVLVGAVDELGTVMEYACGRMLKPAKDGRIKPFAFSLSPEAVPGEGSVFFLLTRETSGAAYAAVEPGDFTPGSFPAGSGLLLTDNSGMSGDESGYRVAVAGGMQAASYMPVFGSIMTGSAFQAAAGALVVKRQMRYACPVQDNPHCVNICSETVAGPVSNVLCLRLDCRGQGRTVRLMH